MYKYTQTICLGIESRGISDSLLFFFSEVFSMHIHEYQAQKILKSYGIPFPESFIVSDLKTAKEIVKVHQLKSAVIKMQVHAGGRGKAGGVKFANSSDEILKAVDHLLNFRLVNEQTTASGLTASTLLISSPLSFIKEYYLGAVIDREKAQAILIASREGGADIEETLSKSPEKVIRVPIALDGTMRPYHLIQLAKGMGWKWSSDQKWITIVKGLAKAFVQTDSELLEINPLVETKEGDLFAIDCKMTIDESALFRQKELESFYDPTQLPENERKAHEWGLAYVEMGGNIGCIVNGAGLAMATMDIIQVYGGKPANFLDVGGGATGDKISEGFKLILKDRRVKSVLINIFGGILNCQTLAKGVISAALEVSKLPPIVIRLEGTEVEKGRELIQKSGLNLIVAHTLRDAAEKAVEAASCQS